MLAQVFHGSFTLFLLTLISFFWQLHAAATCKDKFKVFPSHSACLPRSPQARIPGPVEKNVMLAVHNKYREKAAKKYNAKNILKMIWDDEVAMVAQKWAENCFGVHDKNYQRLIPGRFPIGQNIASSKENITWETVVQLFYDESKDFHFGGKNNMLKKVGHFTQLTWFDSYILGCGYAICSGYHFYVCNYAPSGNHKGQLGFPFSTNGTNTDLRDCKKKICEGGSKLDPLSCQCLCRKDYYNNDLGFYKSSANNCKLTCKEDKKEKFFCGNSGYGEKSCLTLSNMPFDCPYTCRVCPYSDEENYREGNTTVVILGSSDAAQLRSNLLTIALLLYLFSYTY
ncbi:cysteine-rich venom protein LEI1-like [Mytilus galloprovincialis]|uniref:cysteine-rich venom protein LEI1-like n=1 Tax=Mytilus galloprovincialis TaxID=29158 RepID=UPI003F7B9BF5